MIKKTLLVLGITLLAAPQAEARSIEKIFSECGIGGAIFTSTPIAAAISNIIWDLGTTATTSDLSDGCSKNNEVKIALFVVKSYDQLENEIAVGKGDYVDTLSSLSGKSISDIRTSFSKVVSDKSYATLNKKEKANKLYNIVAL